MIRYKCDPPNKWIGQANDYQAGCWSSGQQPAAFLLSSSPTGSKTSPLSQLRRPADFQRQAKGHPTQGPRQRKSLDAPTASAPGALCPGSHKCRFEIQETPLQEASTAHSLLDTSFFAICLPRNSTTLAVFGRCFRVTLEPWSSPTASRPCFTTERFEEFACWPMHTDTLDLPGSSAGA